MASAALMAGTTLLGVIGARAAREAKNKAVISTIDRKGRAFVSENEIIEQQRDELDRELGDLLTGSALDSIKAQSASRAIQASSGTVNADVNTEARMTQMLEEQQLLSKAKTSDVNMLRQQLVNRISFRNEAEALRSGMQSGTEAQLGTISAGLQGLTSGMNMLSPQSQSKIVT